MPKRGRPAPLEDCRERIVRIGRSTYVMRYRILPHEVHITRIWHGRENRPR